MDPETPQNQSFVPEQSGGTGEEDQELKKLEEELKSIETPSAEPPLTEKVSPPATPPTPPASSPTQPYPKEALQPPTAPTAPQPSGSKLVKIAIGFLVISFVGMAMYFLGVGKKGPQPPPPPSVSPAPTETPDPTANWETYEDEKLGISFKIPNKEDLVSDYATFNGRAKNAQPATLLIAKPNYNTKMEDCGSLPLTKNCFADPSGWGQTEKVKVTALGGITAISYFVNDVGIGGPVHVVETVSSPIFQMAQAVGGVGLEEMFVQILSTLKLLEPTASASPTTSPSASPQGLTP